MNAKNREWESYVDDAGRRHWRWPAAPRNADDGTAREAATPQVGRAPQERPAFPPSRGRGR